MREGFKDKVIVVTGASSGIGKELALQLCERGAKLSLGARSEEKLKEVCSECESRGGEAIYRKTMFQTKIITKLSLI